MKYIIYNATTGEVLRTLNTNLETIQLNTQAGEGFLPYLSDNFDIHVDVETRLIKPGRIDSRSQEEKDRVEWFVVRRERDKRLADTDWVSMRYLDQTGSIPAEWVAYRNALRDITNQSDPFQIVWPTLPLL